MYRKEHYFSNWLEFNKGLYIPVVCLIAGALFIKGCANWCQLKDEQAQENKSKQETPKREKTKNYSKKETTKSVIDYWKRLEDKYELELKKSKSDDDDDSVSFVPVLFILLLTHVIGVLIMNSPQLVTNIGGQYNYTTDISVFYSFIFISVLLLFLPYFVNLRKCEKSMTILNILSLLELGTTLICISMNNFSLGLFCSVILTPLALVIGVSQGRVWSFFKKIIWLLAHPLLVLGVTVLIYTFVMFPGDGLDENFNRAKAALQQTIVFSIVDSMIYGNWLFSVATCIFIPNWLCFWIVAFSRPGQNDKISPKKKLE